MPSGNESTPSIVLLSGLPGAGKTTFAHRLVALISARHIESDAVRREIFPRPAYTFAESRIVFADVERRVIRTLRAGLVPLVDATNLLEEHRARFHGLAGRFGARVITVRLSAPPDTIRRRLQPGRDGNSQATIAIYERMQAELEPSRHPTICVDSRFPLEPALRLVAVLLEQSP